MKLIVSQTKVLVIGLGTSAQTKLYI